MKVANKYSDYRLKIYADQYKLKLKPNSPFIETERQGTVCFTYIGDQSKDHIMTLSKIDRMTSSFQNEEGFQNILIQMNQWFKEQLILNTDGGM